MGFGSFLKKAANVASAPVRAAHKITKAAIKPLPGGKTVGKWGDKVMSAANKATGVGALAEMAPKKAVSRPPVAVSAPRPEKA
jgi:hypothetical protein